MTKHFERLTRGRAAGLAVAALLAAAPGLALAQAEDAKPSPEAAPAEVRTADTVLQKWPKKIRQDAKILIEKYGEPTSFDDDRLVWVDNGPWRRTTLHRDGVTRSFMGKGKDHLEQTISREVPLDKVADLERFDKRIKIDRGAGELSACADSERANFLTLNLAEDIVTGQRTVAEARAFAVKVKALDKAGKSSPYLDGLIFTQKDSKATETAPMAPEKSEPAPMTPEKSETPPVYDDAPKP